VSYDLSFRGRSKPLSRSALRDWFADREHYAFPDEDAEVVAYDDDVTGVYFHFRFTEDEDGPRLAFEINAFRPHVFALEARSELDALAAAYDLSVSDPQADGIAGDAWDGEQFLRGWTRLNEVAYAIFLRDHQEPSEPLYTLPRAEIERCWRWNVRYEELVERAGDHFFIANIAFVEAGEGGVSVQAMWPSDRPVLLPRVDAVVLVRDRGGQRSTRLVPWDDLAERIPALRAAPGEEPSEHWAVPSLEIGHRLDRFFGKGTRDVRSTLIHPSRIHAIEDVRRARAVDR
jgi:hypothetical protein